MAVIWLTIAASGFASNYVFQSLPNSAFSGDYYRGGFESKMTRWSRIKTKRRKKQRLGVSPIVRKRKIRDAHLQIMILNHPGKGGSPCIAVKINKAKGLLEG